MPDGSAAALSYHEPDIVTILVLSSFILLENAINYAFDRLLFCGLIGQIAIGIAWGTPGANLLSQNVQETVMQLGYLGLILLVYEGGLSTDLKTLKSNLFLSSLVALIGISVPIGLSFALRGFMDITPLQAFAAGAALCSTSLGTTFTILKTSGLDQSRLGVVLSSAAMMDDIVGLVMSGIISSLGQSSGDFSAIAVIRPVFVSVAFAFLIPVLCSWLVRPVTKYGLQIVARYPESRIVAIATTEGAAVVFHTAVLLALVTGGTYAGTSNLFTAFLAGTVVSWWDAVRVELSKGKAQDPPVSSDQKQRTVASRTRSQVPAVNTSKGQPSKSDDGRPRELDEYDVKQLSVRGESQQTQDSDSLPPQKSGLSTTLSGTMIFEKYYSPALRAILKPFFFASIGFSIPITRMFEGSVVWRGVVYSMLMIIAKMVCGLCLVRLGSMGSSATAVFKVLPNKVSWCWSWSPSATKQKDKQDVPRGPRTTPSALRRSQTPQRKSLIIPKPLSLYPAALLGSAMVARGEIGFLISSIAETNGIFGSSSDGHGSELPLVVTWAILICTLLGPIAVGTMVRRVKKLQEHERAHGSGKEDPLGIWGVFPSPP